MGASAIENAKRSSPDRRTHCRSFLCHLCVRRASIVCPGLIEKEMVVSSLAFRAPARILRKSLLIPEGGMQGTLQQDALDEAYTTKNENESWEGEGEEGAGPVARIGRRTHKRKRLAGQLSPSGASYLVLVRSITMYTGEHDDRAATGITGSFAVMVNKQRAGILAVCRWTFGNVRQCYTRTARRRLADRGFLTAARGARLSSLAPLSNDMSRSEVASGSHLVCVCVW